MTDVERIEAILRKNDEIRTWKEIIQETNKHVEDEYKETYIGKNKEVRFRDRLLFKRRFTEGMRLAKSPSNYLNPSEKMALLTVTNQEVYGIQLLFKYHYWEIEGVDDIKDELILFVWIEKADIITFLEMIAKYVWGAEWNEAEFMYDPIHL